MSAFSASRRWALAGIVLCALVLCTAGLGSRPFWDYDEAIYAQITHDMAGSADPLVTSRWGQPFFEKPPLYFWLSMGLDSALKNPEWSYRLPSALAGVATVVLVMLIAFEVSASFTPALIAGIVLITTGAFIEASRQLRLDVLTVACIMLAVLFFEKGRRDPRWYAGIGIALALGFLSKMVIVLLAGVYMLWRSIHLSEWSWLGSRFVWIGASIGALLVVPWHVYMTMHFGGAFWDGYFWHNVVDRTGTDVLGGTQTIPEFLSYFFAYAAPWSSFAVLTGIVSVVRVRSKSRTVEDKALFVFAATTLSLLAVFIFSRTRIFYYLLPVYPFAAIMLGLSAERMIARFGIRARVSIVVLCAVAAWVTWGTAFHHFETFRINDQIVADEAAAARAIAHTQDSFPVRAYEYAYWDTIGYYAHHGRVEPLEDDAVLASPFYLLVSTPYMQWHQFDDALQEHLTPMYTGEVVTLYQFQP